MADEKNSLTRAMSQDLAPAPDFIEDSTEGTEHIERNDIKLPRLLIAQKMSPQIEEESDEYIEDLKLYDLFNNDSGKIYEKPLSAIVICGYKPRWVLFRSREEGGGIINMNLDPKDKKCQFGPNGEKPEATQFYDFVLFLPDEMDLLALSFKSTDIDAAKTLNTLIQKRRKPIYAGVYSINVVTKRKDKHIWGGYSVQNNGWIKDGELYRLCKEQHQEMKDKVLKPEDIEVPSHERQPGDEDPDTPF